MTSESSVPELIETVEQLEDRMTRPTPDLVESFRKNPGDLLILGAGGKMGPTLAGMARRALKETNPRCRVYGVSRFSEPAGRESLERLEVETIRCDLLNRSDLKDLPDCPNVIFMAGMKFGTSRNQSRTWVLNTLVPALVAERFPESRIVVFSSGNVYPFTEIRSGGATEETPPEPIGEYAQSVLARERVFEYFSQTRGTKTAFIRLNYAIDLRYGVLLDTATQVWGERPIDLTMGYVNVIWQGDANRQALRALEFAASPPEIFNVTGPETLSVRELARRFGEIFQKEPFFQGTEAETALLSNPSKAVRTLGKPQVPVETMVRWVAHWIQKNGPTLNKPTHFQTRNGNF